MHDLTQSIQRQAAKWILKFEDLPGIEFWADPKLLLRPRGLFVTSAADIMVAPDITEYIEEAFIQARLPYEVLIPNLQVRLFVLDNIITLTLTGSDSNFN